MSPANDVPGSTPSSAPALEWPLDLVEEDEDREIPPETIPIEDSTLTVWMGALLGSGSFGAVFAGLFKGDKVAVKLINNVVTKGQQDRNLTREAQKWAALEHPHVLPFLRKQSLQLGQVALLSPFMENGNMMKFITTYPTEDRLILLKQVAEGLRYLHTDAGIVHGDLKCANILISAHRTAVIADFGLSTFVTKLAESDPTKTHIRLLHTVPYAAPELFKDNATQLLATGNVIKRSKTTATDVYAYGMVIYEAITGAAPWEGYSPDEIRNKVVGRERPTQTGLFGNELWKLCASCWAHDPVARPDISNVRTRIRGLAIAGQ